MEKTVFFDERNQGMQFFLILDKHKMKKRV